MILNLSLNLIALTMVSFPIYQPEEKRFRITPNWIVMGSWALTIIIGWLITDVFPVNNEIRSDWGISYGIVFIITIFFIITSFSTYEPLNGALNGEIKFNNDGIIVATKVFELKDIANLDFGFNDFYGQKIIRGYKSVNPILSQGVNNYVTFTDNNNEEQVIYFQLKAKDEYKSLSPFINEAIKLKKMQFKQGIDLVGIENVSI
jgi:hypothetical protein